MLTKGIRISIDRKRNVNVKLFDILEEIKNGNSFFWSILDLNAIGNLGKGKSIPAFEEEIRNSKNGFFINWEDLKSLSYKFEQIIDISIIGCSNPNFLRFYENDQEMYETCDTVIEMIDGGFWEVFSKDLDLINQLAKKFSKTEFLESDYQKDFYN